MAAAVMQKSLTALQNIRVGGLKISGVPGIRNFLAWAGGKIQQKMYFSPGIAPQYTDHVPNVPVVHTQKKVVLGIICPL